MGLDQYAQGLNKEFVWRKHARLQVFMREEYEKQNPKDIKDDDMGLGFNGGPVNITLDLLKRLEEAIKSDYHMHFCSDGFFWGQQYQEESLKEYKKQDLAFVRAAKIAIKNGREITYSCSW